MGKKKSLEQEINEFLDKWDCRQNASFLRDIIPFLELYDVEEENDWVKNLVGDGSEKDIRLIRTVYLISRIAELHAGLLCQLAYRFKGLWKRMEKEGEIREDSE